MAHRRQLPNGNSLGSAIFAQIYVCPTTDIQTDRLTDTQITLRATYVAIGRVCVLRAGSLKFKFLATG